jgi:ATP-dependent Clp protease ATP-binding subunit ClpC
MTSPPENGVPLPLSPGAEDLVSEALAAAGEKASAPGIHHWILILIQRVPAMACSAGFAADLQGIAALRGEVEAAIKRGEAGPSLDRDTAVARASARARSRGANIVYESDLASAIFAASGRTPVAGAAGNARAGSGAASTEPKDTTAPQPDRRAGSAKSSSSVLTTHGRDLTALARDGKLSALVGRDEEIALVIETLCRRITRNPALVGPAGVGKTAIAEGLAQRIARGEVPALLKGVRLVELQAATLVAGTTYSGSLEERIRKLIEESSRPDVVLFIDEVHSLMGAGGARGLSDVASQLKPALARGDLACIAATTDEEYERFIESDKALERRFQPIRIQEPTSQQTLAILERLAEDTARSRGVSIEKPVLTWVINFAEHSLRNRHFPAKAVDLLEQCVARAIASGVTAVSQTIAEDVARRMTGMPLEVGDRIHNLTERLRNDSLLPKQEIEALVTRLMVTMRGFDVRPHRPNAVLLLAGEARATAPALAVEVARALFGSPDRVIDIDFSRFVHDADVTMLLGAPPGYVGYSEHLPIHGLLQTPWAVLRLDNVHACHPSIAEVLAQALESGFFTDARGKRIYLSDSVVIMSALVGTGSRRKLGFVSGEADDGTDGEVVDLIRQVLGNRLACQCDVIVTERPATEEADGETAGRTILETLASRYTREGLIVQWDPSLLPWLKNLRSDARDTLDWERLVEGRLGTALAGYGVGASRPAARSVLVSFSGEAIQVRPLEGPQR